MYEGKDRVMVPSPFLILSSLMSQFFPRDRSYAAAPSTHNVALAYGFSPTFVQTGGANSVTGNYIPMAVDPSGFLQVAIANATFTGEINVDVPNTSAQPSGYSNQTGLYQQAGLAVVTSGFNPQYPSGSKAPTAIDNINGGILSVLSDLDQSVDSITSYVPSATTTSNYTPSGNGINPGILTGNVLLSNPNRIQSYIQVIGSGGPLYVKLGSAPASTGSFSVLLKAATSDFGTDGGVWSDNGFWKGDVSISGGLGTRIIAWEA